MAVQEELKKSIGQKLSERLHLNSINQKLNDTLLQNQVSKTFKIDKIADGTVTVTKGAFGVTVNVVDGVATVLGVHKIAQVVGLENKNKNKGEQSFETVDKKKVDINQLARKIGMGVGVLIIVSTLAYCGYKQYSKIQRSKYGDLQSDAEMTNRDFDNEKVPNVDSGNLPTITSPKSSHKQ